MTAPGIADGDIAQALVERVVRSLTDGTPLRIRGGDSKAFCGRPVDAADLDLRGHRGIVSYDPAELVVTARAGTPVAAVTALLDAHGQNLPCEPPDFDGVATIGGTVAAGWSGPRRPWAGSIRDHLLGCRVITGHGKHLRFGGEVIKNVAGYDVSRLMAGAFGCLGVLTEVSLKVLPKPRATVTLRMEITRAAALERLAGWRRQSLPLAGACHDGAALWLRLEGGEGSVAQAAQTLGGSTADGGFWTALRELRLPFFADPRPLWRLSLPVTRTPDPLPGDALVDWGGALLWLKSDAPESTLRLMAAAAGGHATCLTPRVTDAPVQPLPAPLLALHRRLKAQLDPQGIFNPGRMFADL